MKVETLIDKGAAGLLFAGFVLSMSGGLALTKATAETTTAAIHGATVITFAGFAFIALGLGFIPALLILPRRWLKKELRRPTVSVEW